MSTQDSNKTRRRSNNPVHDPNEVSALSYSDAAGVQKTSDFGKHLKPIQVSPGSYSVVATTARRVPAGTALAVFNNSATVASVTTSPTIVASLAAGVADASGNVGIPLAPNSWTYLNTYTDIYVIASAATVFVFLIEDDTEITVK